MREKNKNGIKRIKEVFEEIMDDVLLLLGFGGSS